jgi:predicted HicB family RNase H-like nuclease
MPKTIFPPKSTIVRFDTRILKETHYDLIEITRQQNISLNQAVNAAIADYIKKYKKS